MTIFSIMDYIPVGVFLSERLFNVLFETLVVFYNLLLGWQSHCPNGIHMHSSFVFITRDRNRISLPTKQYYKGFAIETTLLLFGAMTLGKLFPVLILATAIKTKQFPKVVSAEPITILVIQLFSLAVMCDCRYSRELVALADSFDSFTIWFTNWRSNYNSAVRGRDFLNYLNKNLPNEIMFFTAQIKLAYEVKKTKTNVAAIIISVLAHLNLGVHDLLSFINIDTFAQAEDTDNFFLAAFEWIDFKAKYLHKINRIDRSASALAERFTQLKMFLRRHILKLYGYDSEPEYSFAVIHPELYSSNQNLLALSSLSTDEIAGHEGLYLALEKETLRYHRLIYEASLVEMPKEMVKLLSIYKDLAKKMDSVFHSMSPSFTEIRQKPVCFGFFGMSDTGKSSNLVKAACRHLLRNENFSWTEHVFAPCKSSDYWTTYSPITSKVFLYDDPDALKRPELINKPSDCPWTCVIDIVNTSKFVINQAAINEKGQKFGSKICAITNNAPIDTRNFKEPKAMHNRVASVEVIPRDDYLFFHTSGGELGEFQGKTRFIDKTGSIIVPGKHYYFLPKAARKALNEKGLVNMRKNQMIMHVDYLEFDEDLYPREEVDNPAVMDYCVYRVLEGSLSNYGSYRGIKIEVGDIITSDVLLDLLDQDREANEKEFRKYMIKNADDTTRRLDKFLDEELNDCPDILPLNFSLKQAVTYATKEFSRMKPHLRSITMKDCAKAFLTIVGFLLIFFLVKECLRKAGVFSDEDDPEVQMTENDGSIDVITDYYNIPVAQGSPGGQMGRANRVIYRKGKAGKHFNPYQPKNPPPKAAPPPKPVAQGLEESKLVTINSDQEIDNYIFYDQVPSVMIDCNPVKNLELRTKILEKASFYLFAKHLEDKVSCCKGFGIKDNVLMIPAHMLYKLKDGFFMVGVVNRRKRLIEADQFEEICSYNDMLFLRLHTGEQFKDMTKHFPREEDYKYIETAKPQLILPSYVKGNYMIFIASLEFAQYEARTLNYTGPNGDDISVYRYLTYYCSNYVGFCGAPLVGTNDRLTGKILGFHCAGNSHDRSHATILTQEFLESIGLVTVAQGLDDFYVGDAVHVPIDRNSQLSVSPFAKIAHEVFEQKKFKPRTAPYWQGENKIEPLQEKLDLFKKLPDNVLDKETIFCVEQDMKFTPNGPRPILTPTEATFGWCNKGSLDLTTGVGYWLKVNDDRAKVRENKKRKNYLIYREGDRIITPSGNPLLMREHDARMELLKEAPIKTTYQGCPKTNEPLKPGKCGRLFYIGDLVDLLICGRLFGTLQSDIMTDRIYNEMAIGVCPYNTDQKDLIRYMTEFEGAVYNDCDVSAMEYNMYYPQVIHSIVKCVMTYYAESNEGDNKLRRNFLYSIFNCSLIWEGNRYEGMNYNPSGHSLTTFLNCMVNRWWKRYAYYTLQKRSLGTMFHFPYSKVCRLVTLGDDSIEAISECVQSWYIPGDAAKVYAEYNIKLTTAEKDQNWVLKYNLTDCTFLRREFTLDESGVPIPRLDKTSIETTLFWLRGKNTIDTRQSVCDSTLLEAWYHGEEYFNKVRFVFTETKKYKKLKNLEPKDYEWFTHQRMRMYEGDIQPFIDWAAALE